jgi:hypothetical protein
MMDPQQLSSDTIRRTAAELIGTPVPEQELEVVTALLNALIAEMAPMRTMHAGDAEPATTYRAGEA